MKVLIFATNYLPNIGGAEIAVREITNALPHIRFDMAVPRFSRRLPRYEKIGNVAVYRFGFGTPADKWLFPVFGPLFARRAAGREYDLVWAIMASHGGIAGARFAKKEGIPLVLTLQEGDDEAHIARLVGGSRTLYRALLRPLHRLPMRRAAAVTAISEYLKARAKEAGVPEEKIFVIPNGADTRAFAEPPVREKVAAIRAKARMPKGGTLVLSVSRFVPKNSIDTLISAMKFLPSSFTLLLVGGGPLEKNLRGHARKEGVAERVVFAGRVPHEEIPAYMHAADVFARTPISEGFGNVFAEAFAAGTPVVASAVGGILDFVKDEETGLLVPPRDPRAAAEAIRRAAGDALLREKIIARARKAAAQRYGWKRIAGEMERVFSRAAAEGARARNENI